MNSESRLTCNEIRANMTPGQQPMILENCICATSTVQAHQFNTDNGCHVSLTFKDKHDPGIRKEIARLLLAAFEKGKDC